MCISVFVWQSHPLYQFILLLNRDEYHNRPTKPAGWWEGEEEILGGRDEVAGGTWLACSRSGRLAFVTNVLELHTLPQAKSRGDLPVRFFKSKKSPREFAEEVGEEANQYNGFNLIVADLTSNAMVYLSNRPKGKFVIQDVPPGIHVLTNANLNSPWHKAQRLGRNFRELLREYSESEIPLNEMVEKLMKDTVKAEESKLPRICSPDWELNLSSIFVQVDTPLGLYGTRSTAGLTVTAGGEVNFYEIYVDNEKWKEQTIKYQIEKPK